MTGLATSSFLQEGDEGLGPCERGGSRRVSILGGVS